MKKIIVLTSLLVSTMAYANLPYGTVSVSPLQIIMNQNGQNGGDIKLANTTDKFAYVNLELSRINNRGTTNQEKVKFMDGDISPIDFGLIIQTPKVVVPPQQSRNIKAILTLPKTKLDDLKEALYYQVLVTPVQGPLNNQLDSKDEKGVAVGVSVVISYIVNIIVLPKELITDNRYTVLSSGGETSVTIRNDGNYFQPFSRVIQCNSSEDYSKYIRAYYSKNKVLPKDGDFVDCKVTAGKSVYQNTSETFTFESGQSDALFWNSYNQNFVQCDFASKACKVVGN